MPISFPLVRRCFHTLACLLAALHLVGGHWGVLQMVAWSKMLAQYGEERGLAAAVQETFDGKHACSMCKKIAAGREEEREKKSPVSAQPQENSAKWIGMSFETIVPTPRWRELTPSVRRTNPLMHVSQWDAQPPVPPPELAA